MHYDPVLFLCDSYFFSLIGSIFGNYFKSNGPKGESSLKGLLSGHTILGNFV